jgi:(1->4)-alpha-D-glucan 1-alpha-D-glucosylmutase
VDPDNRRAVPFASRGAALAELSDDLAVEDLLASRRDGRIKLLVLRRALAARAAHASCVGAGSGYLPLTVTGRWAEHVVGFARIASNGSDALLVVAPRLPGAVMGEQAEPPLADVWADTALEIPSFLHGDYQDIFSAGAGQVGDTLGVAAVLGSLPVVVLARV